MKFFTVLVVTVCALEQSSAHNVQSNQDPAKSKYSVKKSCRLPDLRLQENLDLKRMEGKWYGTYKTAVGNSLLSFFTEIYDTRVRFKRNTEGGFDMTAIGSKFYGGWCPKGKGKAVIPEKDYPERMTMFFDTSIGRKIGMKPAWILSTDYVNYAILYSCWKELPDGRCDPDNTYGAVIQRSQKPLAPNKKEEVETALKSACMDFTKMSAINHYGYCTGHEGL